MTCEFWYKMPFMASSVETGGKTLPEKEGAGESAPSAGRTSRGNQHPVLVSKMPGSSPSRAHTCAHDGGRGAHFTPQTVKQVTPAPPRSRFVGKQAQFHTTVSEARPRGAGSGEERRQRRPALTMSSESRPMEMTVRLTVRRSRSMMIWTCRWVGPCGGQGGEGRRPGQAPTRGSEAAPTRERGTVPLSEAHASQGKLEPCP